MSIHCQQPPQLKLKKHFGATFHAIPYPAATNAAGFRGPSEITRPMRLDAGPVENQLLGAIVSVEQQLLFPDRWTTELWSTVKSTCSTYATARLLLTLYTAFMLLSSVGVVLPPYRWLVWLPRIAPPTTSSRPQINTVPQKKLAEKQPGTRRAWTTKWCTCNGRCTCLHTLHAALSLSDADRFAPYGIV